MGAMQTLFLIVLMRKYGKTLYTREIHVWFGYFRLFIVATGCPSERHPQKIVVTGDVQDYRTKPLRAPPGSLTCSVYSTVTRDLGLKSHLKDIIIFRLTSPGIDPATSSFQVERSNQLTVTVA